MFSTAPNALTRLRRDQPLLFALGQAAGMAALTGIVGAGLSQEGVSLRHMCLAAGLVLLSLGTLETYDLAGFGKPRGHPDRWLGAVLHGWFLCTVLAILLSQADLPSLGAAVLAGVFFGASHLWYGPFKPPAHAPDLYDTTGVWAENRWNRFLAWVFPPLAMLYCLWVARTDSGFDFSAVLFEMSFLPFIALRYALARGGGLFGQGLITHTGGALLLLIGQWLAG